MSDIQIKRITHANVHIPRIIHSTLFVIRKHNRYNKGKGFNSYLAYGIDDLDVFSHITEEWKNITNVEENMIVSRLYASFCYFYTKGIKQVLLAWELKNV